jgi:hypothetical protein
VTISFVAAPNGVTEEDALDAGPIPPEFVAVTVNVSDVSAVSPLTVQVSGPVAHVHVRAPTDDVTV